MPEPLTQPTEPTNDVLTEQMVETYLSLRKCMGYIAFCFPFFFLVWTWVRCRQWTPGPSISGYYYSPDSYVRDVFVGVLCIQGVCLALYRGYSIWEDWLFNFAGLFAIGIALFPTDPSQAPCPDVSTSLSSAAGESLATDKFSIHGFCAVSFFALIAITIIFQARESVPKIEDERRRNRYEKIYFCYAGAMIVVPLAAWAILTLSSASYLVFGVEAVAIWLFAFYWRTKSKEFEKTPGRPEMQLMKQRWSADQKRKMKQS